MVNPQSACHRSACELRLIAMAIYHLHAKVIKRSAGQSAVASSAYRSGGKMIDERTGIYCDYSRKKGIAHTQIIAPKNAPSWVHDRQTLWNKVEQAENRKDAQLAREIEIALPVELSLDEQKKLAHDFVVRNFVNRGMVADIALHDTGKGNPHAHIMLTMRPLEKGAFSRLKNRSWNDKKSLEAWRGQWAREANKALAEKGLSERIDHRTLKAQGIDRSPKNLSMAVYQMKQKGIHSDRLQDIYTAQAIAADLEAMKSEYFLIQEQKAELEQATHLQDLNNLEGENMERDYRGEMIRLGNSEERLERKEHFIDGVAENLERRFEAGHLAFLDEEKSRKVQEKIGLARSLADDIANARNRIKRQIARLEVKEKKAFTKAMQKHLVDTKKSQLVQWKENPKTEAHLTPTQAYFVGHMKNQAPPVPLELKTSTQEELYRQEMEQDIKQADIWDIDNPVYTSNNPQTIEEKQHRLMEKKALERQEDKAKGR